MRLFDRHQIQLRGLGLNREIGRHFGAGVLRRFGGVAGDGRGLLGLADLHLQRRDRGGLRRVDRFGGVVGLLGQVGLPGGVQLSLRLQRRERLRDRLARRLGSLRRFFRPALDLGDARLHRLDPALGLVERSAGFRRRCRRLADRLGLFGRLRRLGLARRLDLAHVFGHTRPFSALLHSHAHLLGRLRRFDLFRRFFGLGRLYRLAHLLGLTSVLRRPSFRLFRRLLFLRPDDGDLVRRFRPLDVAVGQSKPGGQRFEPLLRLLSHAPVERAARDAQFGPGELHLALLQSRKLVEREFDDRIEIDALVEPGGDPRMVLDLRPGRRACRQHRPTRRGVWRVAGKMQPLLVALHGEGEIVHHRRRYLVRLERETRRRVGGERRHVLDVARPARLAGQSNRRIAHLRLARSEPGKRAERPTGRLRRAARRAALDGELVLDSGAGKQLRAELGQRVPRGFRRRPAGQRQLVAFARGRKHVGRGHGRRKVGRGQFDPGGRRLEQRFRLLVAVRAGGDPAHIQRAVGVGRRATAELRQHLRRVGGRGRQRSRFAAPINRAVQHVGEAEPLGVGDKARLRARIGHAARQGHPPAIANHPPGVGRDGGNDAQAARIHRAHTRRGERLIDRRLEIGVGEGLAKQRHIASRRFDARIFDVVAEHAAHLGRKRLAGVVLRPDSAKHPEHRQRHETGRPFVRLIRHRSPPWPRAPFRVARRLASSTTAASQGAAPLPIGPRAVRSAPLACA